MGTVSIRDFMYSHKLPTPESSWNALALEDLLVYKKIYDEDDASSPIIFLCTPNLISIYPPNGVPVCPYCKSKLNNIQQYKERDIDDCPSLGRRVILHILFKTYLCTSCGKTYTPPLSCADESGKITKRFKRMIAKEAFNRKKTFSTVADDLHVSPTLVHKIFSEEAGRRSADTLYCAYPHLCIDEVLIHTKKAAGEQRRGGTLCVTLLATHLNEDDEDMPHQAVVAFEYPTRINKETVVEMLRKIENPEIIETISMDMSPTYFSAVQEVFPHCRIIVDRFHLVQSLNDKVSKVASNLYYQKRDDARDVLKQLLDKDTIALSDELDASDELKGASDDINAALEELFSDGSRKIYMNKLKAIKAQTPEQRAAKDELVFLADNYYNRWFNTNPEDFSPYAKARFKRLSKKYPEFYELFQFKELLRVDFFEAATAEKAREIADGVEARIPNGKIYRPLKSYFKRLNHSDWTEYIYDYFSDPIGCRYSNAAMEKFNGTIKEMNRNAKGLTPEVLRHKVLFGTVTHHKKEKHLTRRDIDISLDMYYMDSSSNISDLISFNDEKFADIAVKYGLTIPAHGATPRSVIKDMIHQDIMHSKWSEFVTALIASEHDPEPAIKLFEPYPVYAPFPVPDGEKPSYDLAFAVLAEDVDALTADKVKMNYSKFDDPKHESKLWLPTEMPDYLPKDE